MKRFISIVMTFLLCFFVLTACGSSDTNSDTSSDNDIDLNTEDLCYATTGIPGDSVLFIVDGNEVTTSNFLYWLAYDISYYEYYSEYYGEDFDLEADAETYLNEAVGLTCQYVLLTAKAQEEGVELTEEQQSEIDTEIEETIEQYGGEEEYKEALRQIGIDEDLYRFFITSSYYGEILEENEGDPTKEELEQYIEDNDLLYMKHILLMTVDDDYEPLSDEEKEEKYELAEDILQQLQNSDNLEETFDELMNEYSEDTGLETYPDGYLFTSGEMVEPVEDAIRELEYGQLSDIVEYDGTDEGYYSGYHIILRLDPADNDEVIADWRTDKLTSQLNDWIGEADYEYSDEWDTIDVVSFYEKYSEYENAFYEQSEAESTEEDVETTEEIVEELEN